MHQKSTTVGGEPCCAAHTHCFKSLFPASEVIEPSWNKKQARSADSRETCLVEPVPKTTASLFLRQALPPTAPQPRHCRKLPHTAHAYNPTAANRLQQVVAHSTPSGASSCTHPLLESRAAPTTEVPTTRIYARAAAAISVVHPPFLLVKPSLRLLLCLSHGIFSIAIAVLLPESSQAYQSAIGRVLCCSRLYGHEPNRP